MDQIFIKIDENKKHELKRHCLENNTSMTKLIISLIDRILRKSK